MPTQRRQDDRGNEASGRRHRGRPGRVPGATVQEISSPEAAQGGLGEYRQELLARVAIEGSPLASLRPHLTGPIGVVIARKDPAPVAKALQGFAKTNPALQVRVGVVDGQLLDPQGLKAVADLPSRDALRSQLVGALQGPLAQLVGLLQAPQRELAFILAERGKQAPAESAEQAGPTESDSTAPGLRR